MSAVHGLLQVVSNYRGAIVQGFYDMGARAIDEGAYRPSRIRIVLPALIVVVLGGASLVWLLWL